MIDVTIDDAGAQSIADRAMDRYADGDEAAFGTLYEELATRLYRYALRQTGSRHAAEDVVQQTFLQIHSRRSSFLRGAAVLTWAYAIARHLVIDANRRRSREELSGEEALGAGERSSQPGADEAMALKEQELAARRDLQDLPLALRESFQLVKLEGLSVAEAAEVLGITPGMVKVRAHRAKVALERALAGAQRRAGLRPPSPPPDPGIPRGDDDGSEPDARPLREPFPTE